MTAKIFKYNANYFLEYYNEDGQQLYFVEADGGFVSCRYENPLREAVRRAKAVGCKSICIEY